MSRLVGYWDKTETLASRTQEEERDHGSCALEGCRFSLTPLSFLRGRVRRWAVLSVISSPPCCSVSHHSPQQENGATARWNLWNRETLPLLPWAGYSSKPCHSDAALTLRAQPSLTHIKPDSSFLHRGVWNPLSGETLGSNSVRMSLGVATSCMPQSRLAQVFRGQWSYQWSLTM